VGILEKSFRTRTISRFSLDMSAPLCENYRFPPITTDKTVNNDELPSVSRRHSAPST
jgi:hypothetical protein